MNSPAGIDVDPSGNLYVADDGNNPIQKFTNNGDFVTMWGSKGSKNGQLDRPHDIAVDSSGNNVYVAEQDNFQIQKFAADGKFITKWVLKMQMTINFKISIVLLSISYSLMY
ncbi:MAG TPA: hypothetical protein VKA98_00150 [Nitrososphaeraceae archaeon]|nr:hypothetical protein [Nitrososphaeraceae archaeon]